MTTQAIGKSMTLLNNKSLKITTFLTIALITWIAHFWYFNHLGLYEDDYAFIGNILTMDFSRFVDSVKNMNLAFFQVELSALTSSSSLHTLLENWEDCRLFI